ncbi:hypothetical protein BKA04_002266 [Cryobacterium mesophilum]|uniref:Uncharacterized protein n=1 Tax=Terrimesophilobacter mesophilus TaxID=433647 RepID=A0A4R8VDE3_9MICO|nr:hypothetical protein [Terrimesophilobacter mesophilus]MBB5634043.1 hypothetical protein [Terrimesophilobacter mesophilus]TFB81391.1 hypothetical protein E3N84_00170 [Terrimesophilobacter mesophilus]
MDDFLQKSDNPIILYIVIPAVAILVLYQIIRIAITLALRDHERWLEKRRIKAARTTYPVGQAFPPITPDAHEPF